LESLTSVIAAKAIKRNLNQDYLSKHAITISTIEQDEATLKQMKDEIQAVMNDLIELENENTDQHGDDGKESETEEVIIPVHPLIFENEDEEGDEAKVEDIKLKNSSSNPVALVVDSQNPIQLDKNAEPSKPIGIVENDNDALVSPQLPQSETTKLNGGSGPNDSLLTETVSEVVAPETSPKGGAEANPEIITVSTPRVLRSESVLSDSDLKKLLDLKRKKLNEDARHRLESFRT